MSKTAQKPSSSTTPTTRHAVVKIGDLERNPWNPNRMTAEMYAKAIESIQTYGFVDPLTVFEKPMDMAGIVPYMIIDGEHRFNAGRDLGYDEFPCTIVQGLTLPQAKKLTIVMNELHGQADPGKMGDLLNDILSKTSMDDLLVGLPYSPDILAGFIGLPALPPLELPPSPSAAGSPEQKEPWAERLFRMPKSVALVIDEALEKAKDGEELESWQALERVAADYLAG